jgi:hypothetical protein
MVKKMQKAMKEITSFQKLKPIVGDNVFTEGVEIAKTFLQRFGYKQAKRLINEGCCKFLLFGDVETAKKYVVALEVLRDFKRN